jgi:hypothetical protein
MLIKNHPIHFIIICILLILSMISLWGLLPYKIPCFVHHTLSDDDLVVYSSRNIDSNFAYIASGKHPNNLEYSKVKDYSLIYLTGNIDDFIEADLLPLNKQIIINGHFSGIIKHKDSYYANYHVQSWRPVSYISFMDMDSDRTFYVMLLKIIPLYFVLMALTVISLSLQIISKR